jgi:hypothetical protein
MIIETSANQFYRVTEFTHLPGLDHCWSGIRIKKVKGEWVVIAQTLPSGSIRKDTVRKVGCRIVEA